MAAGAGRNMTILEGGTAIAGLRTKTFTIGNTPIDVTTDDDNAIRALLLNDAETAIIAATREINASFDGVTKNDDLIRDITQNQNTVKSVVLRMTSGATIAGKFALVNLSLTGEMADAQTFSGEMQSVGDWTWTNAPA